MNEVGKILNVIGGCEMAVSFTVLGLFTILHSKNASKPYRKKLSQLFGFFILTSGISRCIGVFIDYPDPHVINGSIKVISGTLGIIAMFSLPKVIKEFARVKTIEETNERVDKTQKAVDTLSEAVEKIDARNPR